MRKINFIIILIITLLACNRDRELITEISGELKDYYTDELIKSENIEIKVLHGVDPSNPQLRQLNVYNNPTLIDKIIVDQEGTFKSTYIDSNEDKYSPSYRIVLHNDSLISKIYYLKTGEPNSINIMTKPIRILNLSIIDTSNQYDKISFDCYAESTDYGEDYTLEFENRDTIVNCNVMPDHDYLISWVLYLNGDYISGNHENIYIENIDTTFYEIYY